MRLHEKQLLLVLALYVICSYVITLLTREYSERSFIQLDLFLCYRQPEERYGEIIANIVAFVPIGLLAALILCKCRVLWAMITGLLVSLSIEFSQLIWHRGVFDVDDIFNNSLGAFIGGAIAAIVVGIVHRYKNKR